MVIPNEGIEPTDKAEGIEEFLNAAFEGGKLPFRMMGVDIHPNIVPVEDAKTGGKIFKFGEWKTQATRRRGPTGKYDQPLGLFGGKIDPRMATALTTGMAMSSYAGLQLAHNFQHPEYFDIDITSPYMLFVAPVKKPEKIPAVTHVDGTGRLQTVSKQSNPLYYDLINEFYKITNVPVIINTSMNVMGEPIVNTPEQAYNMIKKTDMDYIVMGNHLVSKSSNGL